MNKQQKTDFFFFYQCNSSLHLSAHTAFYKSERCTITEPAGYPNNARTFQLGQSQLQSAFRYMHTFNWINSALHTNI